jgi:hypothetical protein
MQRLNKHDMRKIEQDMRGQRAGEKEGEKDYHKRHGRAEGEKHHSLLL